MILKIWLNRILLLFPFIALSNNPNETPTFCGWGGSWNDYYYQIVDQFSLIEAENWAFLNCPEETYCYEHGYDTTLLNITEWHTFFKGIFTKEELTQLIYHLPLEQLNGTKQVQQKNKPIYTKISQSNYSFFKDYLILAKKTAKTQSDRTSSNDWYQGEDQEKTDKDQLLADTFRLINKAPNQFYKNRLGYQAVKLLHYKQDNQKAIDAFKTVIKYTKATDYIYYRALEQVAGAYFNINDEVTAANYYLKVYDNLPDRRNNCALSLRYLDWASLEQNQTFTQNTAYQDAKHFFKAFHGRGNIIVETENIADINVNSPYLKILAVRQMDQIQSSLFRHNDSRYYSDHDDDSMYAMSKYKIVCQEILNNPNLKNQSLWQLVMTMQNLQLGLFDDAQNSLNSITQAAYLIHKKRLQLTLDHLKITTIDRPRINTLFNRINNDPDLNTHGPTVAAFFNHISAVYEKSNPILSAITAINYDSGISKQTFNWSAIDANYAYNYAFESVYPYINLEVINAFDAFLDLTTPTQFEKAILNRLKLPAKDFVHDLRGTWFLANNQLDFALNAFKKVEKSQLFWEEDIRPEIFSGSIKEWMNVSFNGISDKFHLNYLSTITTSTTNLNSDENYKDNKIKLTSTLISLNTLAKTETVNTADYYYMLGNAWYNMSADGWFVNNLFYIDNNNRNDLLVKYQYDNDDDSSESYATIETIDIKQTATNYFQKGLTTSGTKETKAKLLFMLAKANSCHESFYDDNKSEYFITLCNLHKTYFETLKKEYSDTKFYQEILKECSWF